VTHFLFSDFLATSVREASRPRRKIATINRIAHNSQFTTFWKAFWTALTFFSHLQQPKLFSTMPGIMNNSLNQSRRRRALHKAPVLTGLSRMSQTTSCSHRGSRSNSVNSTDSTESTSSQVYSRTPVMVQQEVESSGDDWGFFCDPVPLWRSERPRWQAAQSHVQHTM